MWVALSPTSAREEPPLDLPKTDPYRPRVTALETKYVISDDELNGLLARYTRDVTAIDRTGKFDPVTGRDQEVDLMTLILLQRLRKNILLIGGAGVGKTALFIGLAQLINADKVPGPLKGARLIELEMSMLSAGTTSRSDFEGRLMPILKGVAERNTTRKQPPVIFCIDEIHQLMLTFKASGFNGVIDLMKPYLTAGDLYVVGATTIEEYEDYVKTDPAIDRRFQKIHLSTPDAATTLKILINMKPNFEKHYGIEISRESCLRIVKLADHFLRLRNNPDKSIITLDLACARCIKDGDGKVLDDDSIRGAIASEAGVDKTAIK